MYILSHRNLFQYPVNQPVRNTGQTVPHQFSRGINNSKMRYPTDTQRLVQLAFLTRQSQLYPLHLFFPHHFYPFLPVGGLVHGQRHEFYIPSLQTFFHLCQKRNFITTRTAPRSPHVQQNPRSLERRQIHPLPVHGLPR